MTRKGEITVFLSMILLCVSGLLCVMLESARSAGAKWYLQMAAGSSVDSLFSQYHRQLWQEYHLLGLEYQSEEELGQRILGFLDPYMKAEHWYPMEQDGIEIREVKRLTDEGGLWLEKEILAYMKYGIWSQLDIRPEEADHLWEGIREAASMKTVTTAYEKRSDGAWELEMALEKIYECLAKQQNYHQLAAEELSHEEEGGFYNQQERLTREIGRIPGLVSAYERQADRLLKEIEKLETVYHEQGQELRPDMNLTLGQELEQYRAYVQVDGARRQEIIGLRTIGESNLALIDRVKSQVASIEEYQSSLEEEEEDESDAMWEEARSQWSQFRDSGMVARGKKQEEKRGWLARIRKLADGGLLELVIPSDREISATAFPLEGLPSTGKGGGETDQNNLLTRVLVNEYCSMHMTDFLGKAGTGDEEVMETEGVGQQYEIEYLIGGMGSDRENLAETVKKLLLIREGMNLMYLLSDHQKREEARVLALAITGAMGLTPLVEITAIFILSIWALGESVMDIRSLLSGGRIPVIKKKSDWYLGLEQLLEFGKSGQGNTPKSEEHGLTYRGYLKMLLLAEESERKYYRMMDVMQMKLQQGQPGFRMEFCAYYVDMETVVCGKHVFFSLPFVENLTGSREHVYPIRAVSQKAY